MAFLDRYAWLSILVLAAHQSAGQVPDQGAYHKQWKGYFKEVSAGYTMTADGHPDQPFEVTREPVHSYYNAGNGAYNQGAFFIWSRRGRAEAIAAIWCYGRMTGGPASVVHEMHSLSMGPFHARQKGSNKYFWMPRDAGLQLSSLPDTVTPPRRSRAVRLAQMRSIARDFTGYVHRRTGRERIRLHQQPLFRYEDNARRTKVVDGAVFALFSAWDPEIILVLEAHQRKRKMVWVFSGVRFCNVPLSLEWGDAEVWRVNEVPQIEGVFNTPTDAFYAVHGVEFVDPGTLPNVEDQ